MNELFTLLIHQPVYNLLIVLYRLFSENLGLAIIVIALLSRLILLPLALRQNKMMAQNKEFSERIKEIKAKYKNDKVKQQEEMMKAQSEFMPAQLAGCLPLILQFILLITINNVFSQLFIDGISSFSRYAYSFVPTFPEGYVLNTTFLGIVDLNVHPNTLEFNAAIIPYLGIILLVGLTQYLSTKFIQPAIHESKKEQDQKKEKKSKKEENPTQDFSEVLAQSTKQTMFLFPILIMTAAYSFATGLSLYWIAQSTFVIIQQILLRRLKKI